MSEFVFEGDDASDACVFLQLFGYNNSCTFAKTNVSPSSSSSAAAAADKAGSMSVFAVSAKRQVGEAGGTYRRRRDTVMRIRRVHELDCYLTVSQRGIISTWTNNVIVVICIVLFFYHRHHPSG